MSHKEIASTKYLATLTNFCPMFQFYTPEKVFRYFQEHKNWDIGQK